MNKDKWKRNKNRKYNIRKEGISNWHRLKNYKQTKIEGVNNMKGDNFNIENKNSNKYLLKKKL